MASSYIGNNSYMTMGQVLCGIGNREEGIYNEFSESNQDHHRTSQAGGAIISAEPPADLESRASSIMSHSDYEYTPAIQETWIEKSQVHMKESQYLDNRLYQISQPALRPITSPSQIYEISARDDRQCTEPSYSVPPSQFSQAFTFKPDRVLPVKADHSAVQKYSQLFGYAPALKQDTRADTPEVAEIEHNSQQLPIESSDIDSSLVYQIPISNLYNSRSMRDFGIKCPLSADVIITSSTCDHNGGILNTKDGIKLTIPKDAIKDGDFVSIYTATGLYGPFVLPQKCQTNLVSPFYWIGPGSYHFQKPVLVEFEHFAVVTCDPSHYQLLTCEDDDGSYTMQPVDYDFDLEVQGDMLLCVFRTYHFCSYCLFHNSEDPVINRIGAFYLKPQNFQYLNHFTVEIWFSFLISYCLKRNKELYKKKGMILDTDCSCIFEVSSDKRSTSYFALSYDNNFDDWCVDHLRSAKIQTKDINFYNHYSTIEDLKASEENFLFPPCFILKVTKKSKCIANLDTNVTVTLCKNEGKKSMESIPFNLFVPISVTIKDPTYINIPKNNNSLHSSYNDHSITIKPQLTDLTDDHQHHNNNLHTLKDKSSLHSITDHHCQKNKPELADLIKYSTKISSHWREIALQLKLSAPRVSTINLNHQYIEDKCYAMFNTWLNKTISPCWCHFIQALYHVGLDGVAEEAIKHLKGYENINITSSNVDECNSKDDPVDPDQLVQFLEDVPESKFMYFITRLLHKESAIHMIKDIRHNGGSRENNIKKIYEAFLKEKDPSWIKVYKALKEAKCNDLADIVEACFLPV